jgi:hypothetical protein
MKGIFIGLLFLFGASVESQTGSPPRTAATPARPTPPPAKGEPVWPAWFDKNTMVTEKPAYVHILWNARDAAAYLDGKDKKRRLAEAARQLVLLQYPKGSRDSVRIDVVFVKDRDQYGLPKWDALQRVAHLEFSRSRLLAPDGAFRRVSGNPEEGFDKFEIF